MSCVLCIQEEADALQMLSKPEKEAPDQCSRLYLPVSQQPQAAAEAEAEHLLRFDSAHHDPFD